MANKELQYRTFNELLDEVKLDFNMYELESMIDPAQILHVHVKRHTLYVKIDILKLFIEELLLQESLQNLKDYTSVQLKGWIHYVHKWTKEKLRIKQS